MLCNCIKWASLEVQVKYLEGIDDGQAFLFITEELVSALGLALLA